MREIQNSIQTARAVLAKAEAAQDTGMIKFITKRLTILEALQTRKENG